MSDYEFVLYRPEFRDRYLELLRDLWSADVAVNAEHLDWKYERNPNRQSPPLIVLALYRGEPVGTRAAYGAKWVAGNPAVTIPALCVGDLVVAPAHRGRLLFYPIMNAILAEMAGRGFQYAFGMSGSPTTHSLALLGGFQPAGEYVTWRREGAVTAGALADFRALDPEPRPEAMAELVDSLGSDGRIRHVRDAAWYSWRFRNPLSEFRFLYSGSGGRLEGFLAIQISRKSPDGGLQFVEWEAVSASVRKALLRELIKRCGKAPINVWSASLPPEALHLLRRNGFVPRIFPSPDYKPGPLIKPVHGAHIDASFAGRRLMHLADWDLRMSFSDSY